jgi:hypothetical protein
MKNLTKKIKQIILKLEPFLPRLLFKWARNLLHSKLVLVHKFSQQKKNKIIQYQNVIPVKFLDEIHDGPFSEIHERFAKLDTHIGGDTNVTRMRVYTLCTWASVALSNTKEGDFVAAGISFGTSSLVVNEYLNLEKHNRRQYFIDPMDGRGRTDYNTSIELVKSRWNSRAQLFWIQEPLSISAVQNISKISFAHLNTNVYEAELECLPELYKKLVLGGVMVMDIYGWKNREEQRSVNRVLDSLGAKYFVSPTLQLIILKQG